MCTGTAPALRREANQGQHEGERRDFSGRRCRCDGVERGRPSRRGRDAQPRREQQKAQVRHHGIPESGLADSGTVRMVAEHEHRRSNRHDLPGEQEGHDVPGERHQLHSQPEGSEGGPPRAGGGRAVGVANAVERADDHDDAADRSEEATQGRGVPRQRHCRQGSAQEHDGGVAGQRSQAGGGARGAQGHGRDSGQDVAHSRCGRPDGYNCCDEEAEHQGDQRPLEDVHRPVTRRSAWTITAGSGGQPGTTRSTSTTSATDPRTPNAPRKTPQS